MSMRNYPLQPNKVNWRILHPLNVLSTEEYIQNTMIFIFRLSIPQMKTVIRTHGSVFTQSTRTISNRLLPTISNAHPAETI